MNKQKKQQLRSRRSTVRKVYWTKIAQNGRFDHFGPKWPYSEPDFGIRETKMDQNGPFWPKEVYFGPFGSPNRTLATPEQSCNKIGRESDCNHIAFSDRVIKRTKPFVGKDQKGLHKRGIHDRGDFWKFPLETTV